MAQHSSLLLQTSLQATSFNSSSGSLRRAQIWVSYPTSAWTTRAKTAHDDPVSVQSRRARLLATIDERDAFLTYLSRQVTGAAQCKEDRPFQSAMCTLSTLL